MNAIVMSCMLFWSGPQPELSAKQMSALQSCKGYTWRTVAECEHDAARLQKFLTAPKWMVLATCGVKPQ